MHRSQPATETVFGAPVIVREDGSETVVEVRSRSGLLELKRFEQCE